jgi:hypothetical protein
LVGDDIYIRSNISATHVIVDIMGYYSAPEATAPDQYIAVSDAIAVSAGSTTSISAPPCSAGYRLTGGGHQWANWNEHTYIATSRPEFVSTSGANLEDNWQCQVGIGAARTANTLRCISMCARIPGR